MRSSAAGRTVSSPARLFIGRDRAPVEGNSPEPTPLLDVGQQGGNLFNDRSDSGGNAGDDLRNLVPTNNVIANNHLTQVNERGDWHIQLRGMGDRFSHNLVHDAAGQLLTPGGPLSMIDHNEIFNTGYAEGDGGVVYSGASLTAASSGRPNSEGAMWTVSRSFASLRTSRGAHASARSTRLVFFSCAARARTRTLRQSRPRKYATRREDHLRRAHNQTMPFRCEQRLCARDARGPLAGAAPRSQRADATDLTMPTMPRGRPLQTICASSSASSDAAAAHCRRRTPPCCTSCPR